MRTPFAAAGFAALSILSAAFCVSGVAHGRTVRTVDARRCSQRTSPRPPASTAPAGPCIAQERDAGFETIGRVASTHGGIRTTNAAGRTSWMFPSESLFRDESGAQPAADAVVFRAIVAEMRAHATRRYLVIAYARENAGGGAEAATRTRARALVDRLVGAGLDRDRFDSRGAGTAAAEEIYDGPSTLAPGTALIEIALVRGPTDATHCPP